MTLNEFIDTVACWLLTALYNMSQTLSELKLKALKRKT